MTTPTLFVIHGRHGRCLVKVSYSSEETAALQARYGNGPHYRIAGSVACRFAPKDLEAEKRTKQHENCLVAIANRMNMRRPVVVVIEHNAIWAKPEDRRREWTLT